MFDMEGNIKIQYDLERLMFLWHNWFIFVIYLYYNVCDITLYEGNEEVLIFIKKVWDCSHIMVVGALRGVGTFDL